MAAPEISVIVPVYRVETYLDRCVQSILAQTFRDFELILVDDGSPDRCPQLCEEWAKKDSRIRVLHQPNSGAGAARNRGLRQASGQYISFVDSDDWISPAMLARLHQLIRQYGADMSLCEWQENTSVQRLRGPKRVRVEKWDQKQLLERFFRMHGERSCYAVCGILFRKAFLNEFTFVEGKMNEDIAASYWFAKHAGIAVHTNEIYYAYFQNRSGITASRFSVKNLDALAVWDIVRADVKKCFPQYLYECEMNQKRTYFTLLTQMYVHGYDKNVPELCRLKDEFKQIVRRDYMALMRWKMPINRKILLTIVCFL